MNRKIPTTGALPCTKSCIKFNTLKLKILKLIHFKLEKFWWLIICGVQIPNYVNTLSLRITDNV